VMFGAVFLFGWLRRDAEAKSARASAQDEATAIPTVTVIQSQKSSPTAELILPGNVQAITETPILARAEGYLIKRYVDIGDRVKAGELLAELDTPDLDQQVYQAQATLEQANATLAQAKASVEQAKANAQLAEVTAKRNSTLVTKGVLSKQEGDQSDSTFVAQVASQRAAEANVSAAMQSASASQSNLRRLVELQSYKKVRAPFSGIITQRNIDTGALIGSGSTMLFRLAQNDVLRIFVNVPQSEYSSMRVGLPAQVNVTELPGRTFTGRVSRLSGALDTSTRTLLTEVQVPNSSGILLPGMYAQVHLTIARQATPVLIPGDAVIARANGNLVAVVDAQNVVHFRTIQIGRDFGTSVEVISGLAPNEMVIVNPTDAVREAVHVNTVAFHESSGQGVLGNRPAAGKTPETPTGGRPTPAGAH
jgi:RND family efflux transporter MFP subunit